MNNDLNFVSHEKIKYLLDKYQRSEYGYKYKSIYGEILSTQEKILDIFKGAGFFIIDKNASLTKSDSYFNLENRKLGCYMGSNNINGEYTFYVAVGINCNWRAVCLGTLYEVDESPERRAIYLQIAKIFADNDIICRSY
jgi:hypothetical protein